MIDDVSRQRLEDIRRDVEDAAEEISQAVAKLEDGEATSAEALLGEAVTRLKLLTQRIDDQLGG